MSDGAVRGRNAARRIVFGEADGLKGAVNENGVV